MSATVVELSDRRALAQVDDALRAMDRVLSMDVRFAMGKDPGNPKLRALLAACKAWNEEIERYVQENAK